MQDKVRLQLKVCQVLFLYAIVSSVYFNIRLLLDAVCKLVVSLPLMVYLISINTTINLNMYERFNFQYYLDFYQTSNKVKFTICYRELQFFNQPYPEDLINSIKDQISFVLQMVSQIPSIKFNLVRAVASCRQFSAYKVGLLKD